jgi:hypothetical protein
LYDLTPHLTSEEIDRKFRKLNRILSTVSKIAQKLLILADLWS